MLSDDEGPRQRPRLITPPLDPLGIEELQAYIGDLRSEITRAEAEIAKKQALRNAADSVFKRS